MRRCEEAYRRISEESHSLHPFFPPSVCRPSADTKMEK